MFVDCSFSITLQFDIADKTAVPYIIRHYTTKKEARTIQVPKHSLSTEYTVESSKYTGVNASLDNGTGFVLYSTGSNKTYYFTDTVIDTNPYKIKNTQDISEAKVWFFENITENKYYIYTVTGDNKVMYMVMRKVNNDNDLYTSENKADATVFCVTGTDGNFIIRGYDNNRYIYVNNGYDKSTGFSANNTNAGNSHKINLLATTANIVTGESERNIPGGYLARNVTSTLGYYDINLTGSGDYQLPDSFRGIGTIGYYDYKTTTDGDNVRQDDDMGGRTGVIYTCNSDKTNYTRLANVNRLDNRYTMKVDVVDGKGNDIDVDIYLNKYYNDNYFNKLHTGSSATQSTGSNLVDVKDNTNTQMRGIGLFDSIITADENSVIKSFKLSGSIRTEIYNNTYSTSVTTGEANNTNNWISVGGVCGWATNANWVGFTKINLNIWSGLCRRASRQLW